MDYQSTSLNFGIGLFETMRVIQGKIEFLDAHVDRLLSSVDALNMTWTLSKEEIISNLLTYVNHHKLETCALKFVATENASFVISHRPNTYDDARYIEGFELSVSEIRRHSSNPLWCHKTTNYWLNKLVRNHLDNNEESVFLNEEGALMEGTISNVFLIKGNQVLTPAIRCGLLPGIMRQYVLEWCRANGIEIRETTLFVEDLLDADSVFITNSLMGVMPVTKCIGIPMAKHPWLNALVEVCSGTYL